MVNIIRQQSLSSIPTPSPRTEVGEIDTRAPFQSVKAAVSLFGEVAISKDRPIKRKTSFSSENVLDKETQLLLAQKEVERIKHKLQSAESKKAQGLIDLARAKRTLKDLTTKLDAVSESKKNAMATAEAVKQQAKELELAKSEQKLGTGVGRKRELDHEREQYLNISSELDAAKQQLNKLQQDFDTVLEQKQAALQKLTEAQNVSKLSSDRVTELQKEIAVIKEGIKQLKEATQDAFEEAAKLMTEKDTMVESYRSTKEDAEKKLVSLKNEYDPELSLSLEIKLAATTAEIEDLQKVMKQAHAAEMDSVRAVTTQLNEATFTLQEVADEECYLRNLVNSLREEFEDVQRELNELKEEEERKIKELERILKEEEDRKQAIEQEIAARIAEEHEKLSSETETARREAEEMKKKVEELKRETEAAQKAAQEAEEKLQLILPAVEEAKAAQRMAMDEVNILSLNPDSGSKIRISKQAFESLTSKAENAVNLAEKKFAESMAQLEVINASKAEADRKLEANLKAIEEIKEATDIALKSAEMATTAQSVVEGELRRWRQQEEITPA